MASDDRRIGGLATERPGLLVPGAPGGRRMSLQAVMASSQHRRLSAMGLPPDPSNRPGGATSGVFRQPSLTDPLPDFNASAYELGSRRTSSSKNMGRYEAMTTLRAVQQNDDRREANMRSSTSVYVQPPSMYRVPQAGPGMGGVPPNKKNTSLWTDEESDDIKSFIQASQLSVNSSISQIGSYGRAANHPGKVLDVIPDPYDRESQTDFDELCNELLNVLGEFETSLEEMTTWKDDFLRQTVPSNIKLQLTLLFARLFRSKSDLHEPVFELVKQVKMFSRPWLNKREALIELEKDYQRQCHMVDVAIRKMEQMQLQVATIRSEKRVALWERLARKVIHHFLESSGQFVDADTILEEDEPEEAPVERSESEAVEPIESVRVSTNNLEEVEESSGSGFSSTRQSSARTRERSKGKEFRGAGDHADRREPEKIYDWKGEIRDYIIEDRPSWKAKAKELVHQFQTLLRKHHPDAFRILGTLHRHPFIRNAKPGYYSLHMGSVAAKTRRKAYIRPSWSMIDLRRAEFEEDDAQTTHRRTLLTRSNSVGALDHLRQGWKLLRPFREIADRPVPERVHPAEMDEGSGDETESDDEDEMSDVDDSMDLKYMLEDFDEDEIRETVNRFMEERPMVSMEQAEGIDAGEFEGEKKKSFSLQEVMELTMLHAQQMQLLQFEFEGRLEKLTTAIEQQQIVHADKCEDYEKALHALQERTKRIAHEYQVQAKEASAAKAQVTRPATQDTKVSDTAGTESLASTPAGGRRGASKSSRSKSRSGVTSRQSSRQTAKKKPKTPIILLSRHGKRAKSKHKPVFHSAPFTMSFMDRLRWYTELKLQKRTEIHDKFHGIELAANEERLAQYRLLSGDNGQGGRSGAGPRLPAEFMPMPGDVPVTARHRDTWSQQGVSSPWGGRYNVHQGSVKRPNILNLFDVAMNLNLPSRHPHPSIAPYHS